MKALKKLWDWIRCNAWVQPILFVIIIFALILGIKGIGNASQKSKSGCSKDNGEYIKKILMEDVEEKIDDDSSFILYIGRTDCGGCQSIQPILKRFHKEHADTVVYYLSLDYIENDDESVTYLDATLTSENLTDLWSMIKTFVEEDNTVTPTVAAFKDGDCVGAKVGGGSSAGITLQDIVDLKDAMLGNE